MLIEHFCVLCPRVRNWVACSLNSLLGSGNYLECVLWERKSSRAAGTLYLARFDSCNPWISSLDPGKPAKAGYPPSACPFVQDEQIPHCWLGFGAGGLRRCPQLTGTAPQSIGTALCHGCAGQGWGCCFSRAKSTWCNKSSSVGLLLSEGELFCSHSRLTSSL